MDSSAEAEVGRRAFGKVSSEIGILLFRHRARGGGSRGDPALFDEHGFVFLYLVILSSRAEGAVANQHALLRTGLPGQRTSARLWLLRRGRRGNVRRGRWRWRRCVAALGRPHDSRYLVSLRVHALLIRDVVPPLHGPDGRLTGTDPDRRSSQETAAGTDRGTDAWMAGGGTDGRAQPCPEGGPNGGTFPSTSLPSVHYPTNSLAWRVRHRRAAGPPPALITLSPPRPHRY